MKMDINHPEAHLWNVIDLDSNKKLGRVQWADDNIGKYKQVCVDDNGLVILDDVTKEPKKEMKRGNIKLIKQSIG